MSVLVALWLMMEVIRDGGGKLSIILAGHPKHRNDLKGPTMEEVGYRTTLISLDSLQGSLREYVLWLLDNCSSDKVKPTDILKNRPLIT